MIRENLSNLCVKKGDVTMREQLSLPRLLHDGCVLQQGEKTRIWGWGPAQEEVSVTLLGQSKETVVDSEGYFEVFFHDLVPGGPYVLEVTGSLGQKVRVEQVFVGEVFVCGGQSNMELPMRRVRERFPEEFLGRGEPEVHLYKVEEKYDFSAPLEDHVKANWQTCLPENLAEISAVSYFLGKFLHEDRGVPIGIINLSLGGTPVEAWISREGLDKWPELLEVRKRFQDESYRKKLTETQEQAEHEWQLELKRQEDEKLQLPASWEPIQLPGYLADVGLADFCGSVWLRRKFQVTADMEDVSGLLRFGTMTNSDHIYINGVLVGDTGYCYPPRRYPIPEGLLKAGENTISIRLVCRNGGGRVTPGKPYDIVTECGTIFLEGNWEYFVGARCGPAPEQEFINRRPTGLFQGMTAPCLPYTVRGIIWYQGESNDGNPDSYEVLLKAMICDWRNQWKQEKLPFVIVQLPGCDVDIAGGDAWPRIREAQRRAEELSDTAVTVNLDLGEANDLHPVDKKSVAYRISIAIRGMIYGEKLVWKSPSVIRQSKRGDKIILEFSTGSENGLETMDGEPPLEFEVAGRDRIFYPARAEIRGKEVWVSGAGMESCHLRYAWSRAPHRGLLCNESGLTAGPFWIEIEED